VGIVNQIRTLAAFNENLLWQILFFAQSKKPKTYWSSSIVTSSFKKRTKREIKTRTWFERRFCFFFAYYLGFEDISNDTTYMHQVQRPQF